MTTSTVYVSVNTIDPGAIKGGSPAICSGGDPAPFESDASGNATGGAVTYQWQSSQTSGSGFGDIPSATATTYDPPAGLTQTTYYRRLTKRIASSVYAACEAPSNELTVTVNEFPTASAEAVKSAICSGTTAQVSVTPTNAVAGATFKWTAVYTGVTGSSAGSGTGAFGPMAISETLTGDGMVEYTITPVGPGSTACEKVENEVKVTVTVNPLPTAAVLSLVSSSPMCEGGMADLKVDITGGTGSYIVVMNPTSLNQPSYTSGTTFSTDGLSAGSYTYSLTSVTDKNGCVATGLSGTVSVQVNKAPESVSITPDPVGDICAGTTVNYTSSLTGTVVGTPTYSWTLPGTPTSAGASNLWSVAGDDKSVQLTVTVPGCPPVLSNVITFDVKPQPSSALITGAPGAPVCEGTSLSLASTAITGGTTPTYTWSRSINQGTNYSTVGENSPNLSDAVPLPTSPATTVNYKLEVTFAPGTGCTGSNDTRIVVVNKKPDAEASPAAPAICSGTAAQISVANPNLVSGATFKWTAVYTGVTGSSSGSGTLVAFGTNAISETLTGAGTAVYTIIPVGPMGTYCEGASVDVTVTVNPLPAKPTITGTLTVCPGNTTTLESSSATGNTWSNAATSSSITVGAGSYTVFVTDGNNCVSPTSDAAVVTQFSPPTAAVLSLTSANPTCEGSSASFQVAITGGTGPYTVVIGGTGFTDPITNYVSGASISTANPLTLTASNTPYSYSLTSVTDANGCLATGLSGTPSVQVNKAPTSVTIARADSYTGDVCASATPIDFNSTVVGNVGTPTYAWTATSSGTPASGNAATFSSVWSTGTGSKDVNLSVSVAGCPTPTAAVPFTFTLAAQPTVFITGAPPTAVCEGTALSLGSTVLDGIATRSYAWSLSTDGGFNFGGALVTSATYAPLATYAAGGTVYKVTLSYPTGSNCATQSAQVPVNVLKKPNAEATPTAPAICSGATAQVSVTNPNNVPGATFTWTANYGGVTGGAYMSTPISVASFGTNVISETLYNSGTTAINVVYTITPVGPGGAACTGTPVDVTVTVNPLPAKPTITGTLTVCPGTTTTLTSSSATGNTWSNAATTQSITVGAGSYTVFVTDAKNCVSPTSDAAVVTQFSPPTAAVLSRISASPICEPGSIDMKVMITGGTGPYTVVTAQMNLGQPSPTAVVTTSNYASGATITRSGFGASPVTNNFILLSVTDANGCAVPIGGLSGSAQVKVNRAASSVVITADPAGAICQGTTVAYGASWDTQEGTTSFSWKDGTGAELSTQSLLTHVWSEAPGAKSVQLTISVEGCPSAPSNVISFNLNAQPSGAVITGMPGTSVCEGTTLNLTSTGITGGTTPTYSWSKSIDGGSNYGSSLGSSEAAVFSNAGLRYKLDVTFPAASGCTALSNSTPIGVNQTPVATATAVALTICSGQAAQVNVVNTIPVAGATFKWTAVYTGVTGSSSGSGTLVAFGPTAISEALTGAGTAVYTITPVGPAGTLCEGEAKTVTITVTAPTTPTFTQVPAVCKNAAAPVLPTTSENGITGTWSPAVSTATAGSATYTFTPTAGQCATTATMTITVNELPASPTITGGPTTFCQGGSVTLTSSSELGNKWSTDETTQSINVSTGGSYTVTFTDGNGCTSLASAATTVTVNALPNKPVITSGPTTFCQGGSVILTAPASTSYAWSNGAITQGIMVSTAGSFTVKVKNAAGCESESSDAVTTTVTAPTTPAFAQVAPVCKNAAAPSLPTTSENGITGTWSPAVSTATAGSATYTFTPTAGQCATTTTMNIVVNDLPATPTITAAAIEAVGPITLCTGDIAILISSATSGNAWSTGATSRSITVSTSGSYTVTFTDGNGCSATSAPTVVTVNPLPDKPVITPVGSTTFCQGGSVTLVAPVSTSYLWSNNETTQIITVSTTGSFTVKVKNGFGCESVPSEAVTTTVTTPTTPTFTQVSPVCKNAAAPVLPTTSTNGITGTWSPAVSTATAGPATYTFTPTAGLCATTTTMVITVNDLPATPTITPLGSTTFCQGGTVTLSAPIADSYLWSNGAVTQNIPVTATNTFTVKVKVGLCESLPSAPVTVTVNPLPAVPTIIEGGPTTFCQGGSVTLSAPASTGYLWSNGATTQSITVSTPGNFTLLITNANGCQSQYPSTPVTVTVTTPATPLFTQVGAVCKNAAPPVLPTTSNNGITGTWSPAVSTATAGTATYTFTPTAGQCATTATMVITVNDLPATPVITVGGSITFCQGGSVTLTASSVSGLVWSPGGATTASITVTSSGNYSATATNGNGCSSTSATVPVTVNPLPEKPVITVVGSATFCQGGSVTLSAPASTSYLWSNGATTQSITVSTAGSFTVQVTNVYECQSESSATVTTAVTAPVTPAFNPVLPLCRNDGAPSLPTTSTNGITGTWSPAAVNTSEAGPTTYTFTPTAGQCATTASMVITVNDLPTATITASGPTAFCPGGSVTLTAPASASYLWSTGATTQSITVSTGGSYSVNVTNGSGCSATSAPTVVTVNPLPAVFVVSGGGLSFCDNLLPIYVSNSQAGVTYQLKRGNTLVASQSGGTGTLVFAVNQAGTYTVVAVAVAGGCSLPMSGSAVVSVASAPALFTVSGGGISCGGELKGIRLSDSQVGVSYQLKRGSTVIDVRAGTGAAIDFDAQSAAGNYTVVALSPCNDRVMNGSATITAVAFPAVFSVTGGGTACGSSAVPVGLSGSQSGVSYQLYRGSTPVGTTIQGNGSALSLGSHNITGEYAVKAKNSAGCEMWMYSSAIVISLPSPTVFTVTGGGPACGAGAVISLSGSQGSGSELEYQLKRGNTVVQTIPATGGALWFDPQTVAGTYTVVAIGIKTGACPTPMSGSVSVTSTGALPLTYNVTVTNNGRYCNNTPVGIGLSDTQSGKYYQLQRKNASNVFVNVGTAISGNGSAISLGSHSTLGTYQVVVSSVCGNIPMNNTVEIIACNPAARIAAEDLDAAPQPWAAIAPNPVVSGRASLLIRNQANQTVTWQMMDLQGRTVSNGSFEALTNAHQEDLNVRDVKVGNYLLNVQAGTKKMNLKVMKIE